MMHMPHQLSSAFFHHDRNLADIASCDDLSLVLRNKEALFIAISLYISKTFNCSGSKIVNTEETIHYSQ